MQSCIRFLGVMVVGHFYVVFLELHNVPLGCPIFAREEGLQAHFVGVASPSEWHVFLHLITLVMSIPAGILNSVNRMKS